MKKRADSSIQIQIKEWCMSEGHEIGDEEPAASNEDHWLLEVKYRPDQAEEQERQVPLLVIGHEGIQRISMLMRFVLSPNGKRLLAGSKAKPALIQLRSAGLHAGVRLVHLKDAGGRVNEIALADVIYFDAPITRHLIMNRMEMLYGLSALLALLLGDAGPERPTSRKQRRSK